jgi:hypothetical protein
VIFKCAFAEKKKVIELNMIMRSEQIMKERVNALM